MKASAREVAAFWLGVSMGLKAAFHDVDIGRDVAETVGTHIPDSMSNSLLQLGLDLGLDHIVPTDIVLLVERLRLRASGGVMT